MKNQNYWLIGLIVLLGLALTYLWINSQTNEFDYPVIKQPSNKEYFVKVIRVIQGHEFDLTLTNGRRIHAVLSVKTPKESKDKVVAHINKSTNPKVILYEQLKEGTWVVDLVFSQGSLTGWLHKEKLVWE
jgi:16S rRNA U1498 N3-methylase RsmE